MHDQILVMRDPPGRCGAWRFVFVWLPLLALPVQGFADAWLQSKGKAHIHESHGRGDRDHERFSGPDAEEAPGARPVGDGHVHPAANHSAVAYHPRRAGAASAHLALLPSAWLIPSAILLLPADRMFRRARCP